MNTPENNPLLAPFDTPYQTPPFHAIRLEHYEPAFHAAISQARQEIENIAANPEPPTFANTIEALDSAGERLDTISSIFFNLNSACTSGEMQQIAQRVSPLLSEHANSITLDRRLFRRVHEVYGRRDELPLTPEQATLL